LQNGLKRKHFANILDVRVACKTKDENYFAEHFATMPVAECPGYFKYDLHHHVRVRLVLMLFASRRAHHLSRIVRYKHHGHLLRVAQKMKLAL